MFKIDIATCAAVYLNGRIWIVGGLGSGGEMLSYDVGSGEWMLYPDDVRGVADHMQAVAFENEI